jgi:adenylate cyclase
VASGVRQVSCSPIWRISRRWWKDLADFTPLVENLDSELIVDLLNAYLDGMTGVIFAHGGTVMKIVGDAVHAIFGAPVASADHAAQAVACALAIDDFAMKFSADRNAAGIPLGVTRIGVSSAISAARISSITPPMATW